MLAWLQTLDCNAALGGEVFSHTLTNPQICIEDSHRLTCRLQMRKNQPASSFDQSTLLPAA